MGRRTGSAATARWRSRGPWSTSVRTWPSPRLRYVELHPAEVALPAVLEQCLRTVEPLVKPELVDLVKEFDATLPPMYGRRGPVGTVSCGPAPSISTPLVVSDSSSKVLKPFDAKNGSVFRA
mgnify:CR=1 FL=1